MKVTTTTTQQTANEMLGKKATVLYYIILEEGTDKMIINVGEKTYNKVNTLLKTGQTVQITKEDALKLHEKTTGGKNK